MKAIKDSIIKYWYLYICALVLGTEALVFAIFRQNSYIAIHDNLDLFMAHYQMIKLNNGWFAHNATMPMLHGVNRDLLGSEFLLYNILYIIFPNFTAYMLGMILKIAIGLVSFICLFKDIYGDRYDHYKGIIITVALAYSLIPVFPTYGIAFTSVPLIALLIRRLYYADTLKKRIPLYIAVFCYPIVSYFAYHGFFILAYMCVAVVILWIKDRKFPLSTFVSICVLSAGYILFEYRLFAAMLFDDTVTIRTSMEHGELTFLQALRTSLDEFIVATFHNQDSHTYFILWVSIIAIIVINLIYVKNNATKLIWKDPINLVMGWIILNCLNYGFYEFAPYRQLLETLVPKLTGFEFSRTAYFNTLLWYALLLLICIRIKDYADAKSQSQHEPESLKANEDTRSQSHHKAGLLQIAAPAIAIISVLVVMLTPQVYNDFYYTVYNQAYKLIKHKETSTVNYREFYSTDLFEQVKNNINYNGEWSAAYGLHPAVLNYNGISSIDGYLGMYPQTYKDQWIAIEEEAFAGSPSLADYFKGWGARVCLYSGNDENTYAPYRVMDLEDKSLKVDIDGLKNLDCKYIISRIEFTNAEEKNIELIGTYSDDQSPYTIYVYEIE